MFISGGGTHSKFVTRDFRHTDEKSQKSSSHFSQTTRHQTSYVTTCNMLKPEEESDVEVRRVDQDNINKFARLNARLHDLRAERDDVKVSRC